MAKNPFPPKAGHAAKAGHGHGPVGRRAGAGTRRRGKIKSKLATIAPMNAAGTYQVGG